jgi:hypothetical protein
MMGDIREIGTIAAYSAKTQEISKGFLFMLDICDRWERCQQKAAALQRRDSGLSSRVFQRA